MKIDLLYEIQIPGPHHPRSEYQAFQQALEQIRLADQAGFGCIWAVEHHFLTEFAHSSAPEILLTAAARETRRIRIGCGVTLLPSPFNHPIRVAERVATMDLLCDGRLEWGTGRSGPYEQRPFGIDPSQSREMWQEALEIIPRMWERRRFSHRGRFFDIPERDVIPKPLQDPHPPIWMAATSPSSWEIAARNGIGILGLSIYLPVDVVAEQIAGYRRLLPSAQPVGKFVNGRVGVFTIAHCAPTREQAARDLAYDAAVEYLNYAFKVFAGGLDPAQAKGDRAYAGMDPAKLPPMIRKMLRGEATFDDLDAEDMVIVGDVDHCIRKLERYRDVGCDRLLILAQASRIPHAAVMRSLELFGREIIPHFDRAGGPAAR
jgi:alkanesulfonate monooxygenase SsuD/methylene tetrahydromethanopterin reductase-like flavin-dependent oxidoreductase (luciferase family)